MHLTFFFLCSWLGNVKRMEKGEEEGGKGCKNERRGNVLGKREGKEGRNGKKGKPGKEKEIEGKERGKEREKWKWEKGKKLRNLGKKTTHTDRDTHLGRQRTTT